MSKQVDTQEDRTPGRAGADTGSEFVTCRVGGEFYAFKLDRVKEIIRMPDLVRLPLAPGSLEGIANLRGGVLPVLNLRRVFGLETIEHDDATRVVVLDIGRAVGVTVDAVWSVRTVEADRIESADSVRASIESELLEGVIKDLADNTGKKHLVQVLDIEKVVERECAAFSTARAETGAGKAAGADAETSKANAASEIRQFVSFVVEDQEYALPIDDVQEIVHAPAHVSEVPNAPAAVHGIVTLRDRLVPVLSLRRLFNLPEKTLSSEDRLVIISPDGGKAGMTVGLVTDSVREVLRVDASVIDPLPPMLARDRGLNDITAVCRLDGGKRLVSTLSAAEMFDLASSREVTAAIEELDTDPSSGDTTMTAQSATARDDGDEEQLVVFKLNDEEYAVGIDSVQEIVRVPESLTSVPNTPCFIEGVMNLRGSVIPLVDQRRRFGLDRLERNDRQRVLVFTVRGVRTGFIVDSVTEVRRVPCAFIGPAPEMSDAQSKLIRRVANLEQDQRMLLMLDTDQLLDTSETDALKQAA
jgi:purine-binding chemotaxis protein CheW